MLELKNKIVCEIKPKPPFNFDCTVHNPSHYPTPTEHWEKGKFWQPMRLFGRVYGIKFENRGSVDNPEIKSAIFSQKKITKEEKNRIIEELGWRFEFQRDISEFCERFKDDKILGPVLKKWRGMRSKCGYSLYESLMIYILLQNATVRRTVQMTEALLGKYGTKVRFDGKELFVFWTPEKLNEATEEELRSFKVGYRAKFFKRISEDFAKREFDEFELRTIDKEGLKKKLLKLYGIGPASAGYLLFEVFHRYDVLEYIPPWEQKIYSKLLFGKELVTAEKILAEVEKRFGRWKGFASFYIFTDIFWQHKEKKIDWLEKEIRL